MQEYYLCTSNDQIKNYSKFQKIIQYSKDGKAGSFLDSKSVYIQEVFPVGTVKQLAVEVKILK